MRKIALLSTALLLSAAPALADPLTICGVEWPPFTEVEGPNIVGGISYEIHTEIFKRLNIEVAFKNVPWNRCANGVRTGTYAAITDESERSDLISGPIPISFYPVALYTRPDMQKKSFILDELAGVTVGSVDGYDLPDTLVDKARWTLDLAVNEEAALRKLQAKRYDYYIGDTIGTPALAAKIGLEVTPLAPLLYSDKLYLGFAKKHEKIAGDYYAELAKLKQEGFIDRVYKARLGKTYDEMAQ